MGNLWFELTGEYYKSVKKLESTGDEIDRGGRVLIYWRSSPYLYLLKIQGPAV